MHGGNGIANEFHVIRHSDESQQRARRAAILEPGVLRPSICTRCPGNRAAGAADAARGDDADGVLDSGDYQAGVDHAVEAGGRAELRRRRNQARAEGRFYGIGYAAAVEPSISNMGYITTVLSSTERRAAGSRVSAQVRPSGSPCTVEWSPQSDPYRDDV
jgi:hypothetical protein